MRRYIVLLLITGIVWAQTDFDTLILKSGTAYFGEYSKLEEEIVYFKPQNAFAFQPISIKQIQTLKLKDGRVAVLDSKVKSLTLEEYQKLSTKEKAIYDEENNGVFEKFSYPKSLVNEYDRLYYKQVYYKIKRERRGKVVCATVVITGILVYLLYSQAMNNLSMGGGGNWGMGGYSGP